MPHLIQQKLLSNENKHHLKIQQIINDTTSGSVFKQWIKGVSAATGDYIWIAEADDLCDKTFLQEVMQGFYINNNIALSYTQSKQIDEQGNVLANHYLNYTNDIDKEKLHSAKFDVLALSKMLISLAKNNQHYSVLKLIHYMPKQYIRFSKYSNSPTKLFDSGFQKIHMKISEINKIEVESVIPILKDKNVVFTGNFDTEKQDLMILTRKKGAYIRSDVTAKTDILVEGVQDDKYKDVNGLVSKQRKAREYVGNGAKIQFLNEEDLINLIKE